MFEHVALASAACAAALKQADGARPPEPAQFHVSGEIVVVSDYRRGGATQSEGDPALQGRIDFRHESGWSVGAFASSIHARRGSNAQISLFGAQRFDLGETDLNLGASAVIFIGGDADPILIAQASVVRPVGPVEATFAVNYAPPQASLHGEDGLGLNLRVRSPLGRLNGAPITGAASVGWSQGEFAMGAGTKLDWSLGVSARVDRVEFGLAYVDNDLADDRGDAALVFSIAHRF